MLQFDLVCFVVVVVVVVVYLLFPISEAPVRALRARYTT